MYRAEWRWSCLIWSELTDAAGSGKPPLPEVLLGLKYGHEDNLKRLWGSGFLIGAER